MVAQIVFHRISAIMFLTVSITVFFLGAYHSSRHEENAYFKFLLVILMSYFSILAFACGLQAISLWINKRFLFATIETFKFIVLVGVAAFLVRVIVDSH